jgi:hypothetical protein
MGKAVGREENAQHGIGQFLFQLPDTIHNPAPPIYNKYPATTARTKVINPLRL